MLPHRWENTLRGAMKEAGVASLPPAERSRIAHTVAGRLERHGVRPALHNWGGVLCGRAVHKDCCAEVGSHRLQRFPHATAGARRLVELSAVYTAAVPVAGFRSEMRTEGFFGPSEEAEKTFQELTAAWAGLEADFGPARLRGGFTKDSYETWLAFRDKWRAGDADTTALSALVADVNVTRQNLGRPRAEIAVPDVTQTTAALKTAARIDSAARTATSATADAWRAVPFSVKLGAAVVAALGVILAIFRVTR